MYYTPIYNTEIDFYQINKKDKRQQLRGEEKKMTEIICGGYNPIEHIKDSHVVAIAKFAVSEFNKQNNSKLKFQTVVSGKYQVVCGMNFWLKLNVSDEDDRGCKTYEAHVCEQAWLDSRVLKYFFLVEGS